MPFPRQTCRYYNKKDEIIIIDNAIFPVSTVLTLHELFVKLSAFEIEVRIDRIVQLRVVGYMQIIWIYVLSNDAYSQTRDYRRKYRVRLG